MSDAKFYKAFKANMEAMGLPAPASLFSSYGYAVASIGALGRLMATKLAAGAVEVAMGEMTMAQLGSAVLGGAASATGTAATGAAVANVCAVAGSTVVAFYFGAIVGSLIAATIDTYGAQGYAMLAVDLPKIAKHLGMSVSKFLKWALSMHGGLSPIRMAYEAARTSEGSIATGFTSQTLTRSKSIEWGGGGKKAFL